MGKIEKIINKINKNIIEREEISKVNNILRKGLLSRPGGGPIAKKFQFLMAKKHGKKYACAVNSGTSALHLAIAALRLNKNDEIIVPALANIADCSVIIQEGARPVFADIDPGTFNVDLKDVENKITKNTKAIIAVHMYGEPADIRGLQKITKKFNLILIEDCAQAGGAKYYGKYVGSFGDISCFSFYQTKHIITGEGGMVLTNNEKLFKIMDSLANNGINRKNPDAYDYDFIGYNYQMPEIQGALGIVQLNKLDRLNKIRRKNANLYRQQLKNTKIAFQRDNINTKSSYFYLTGLLPENLKNKRDEFLTKIKSRGVPIKNLYPLSLPEVKVLKNRISSRCLVAQNITKRLFNLYVNPGLGVKDIINFSKRIREVYKSLENEK